MVEKIAQVKNINIEELQEILVKNSKEIYGVNER